MDLTFNTLENYLGSLYREKNSEQSLFMKLVEEVGKAAEILNKKSGIKTVDDSDLNFELGKELADIIYYTLAVAAINGINMNSIIIEKDKMASVKYNRKENLEDFIEKYNLQKAIDRISSMEQLFDELQEAFAKNPRSVIEDEKVKAKFDCVTDYYQNGLWLSDYRLDESGKLPKNLKRGILSEDGFYNFLYDIENCTEVKRHKKTP